MTTNLQWMAIQTRPNCEKKVSKLLKRKGINYYCPINQAASSEANSPRNIASPLFPSMIFVQVEANFPIHSLAGIQYVRNVVYRHQQPAVFPDNEIGLLSSFMESHETAQAVKTNLAAANNLAQVRFDPDEKIYTLELPSMGFQLMAKTETVTHIRLVRKSGASFNIKNSLSFILGAKN